MEAVKRRCQAVLNRAHPISNELRAAALLMLNTGEPSKRARVATGTFIPPLCTTSTAYESSQSSMPSAGTSSETVVCPKCTLKNPLSNVSCDACSTKLQSHKDDGWVCSACTLRNASKATKCKACGARVPQLQPRVIPFIPSDDEDADAFAVPAAKKKPARSFVPKPASANPKSTSTSTKAGSSCAAPIHVDDDEQDDDDDDEWDEAVGT